MPVSTSQKLVERPIFSRDLIFLYQWRIQRVHCRGGGGGALPNRREAPQGEGVGGGYPLPQVGVRGASPGEFCEKWMQMVHSEPIFCRVCVDFSPKNRV